MKLPGLTGLQSIYTGHILSQGMNHSSEDVLRKPEIVTAITQIDQIFTVVPLTNDGLNLLMQRL